MIHLNKSPEDKFTYFEIGSLKLIIEWIYHSGYPEVKSIKKIELTLVSLVGFTLPSGNSR